MSSRCLLILGGSRSGKSSYAEKLAAQAGGKVLFVATAEAGDAEMAQRIAAHKKKRARGWRTLEARRNIGAAIAREKGVDVILIDCLTLLVSNLIVPCLNGDEINTGLATRTVRKETAALLKCFDSLDTTFILVSNEVGLGLVPPYPLGRVYRDLLGEMNQAMARRADEVYLMVAGIPVRIKPQGLTAER